MQRRGSSIALFVLLLAAPVTGWARPEEEIIGQATLALRDAENGVVNIGQTESTRKPPTAEERLAAGDMLLRNKDFPRAILRFNQVLELFRQGRANQASHADALQLAGEAYFLNEQLLSAERVYHELAELAGGEPYQQYAGRALGRLVDIALRTDRLEGLDFVFERLRSLAKDDPSGSLAYARAKAFFARRAYAEAQRALEAVPENSDFKPQAGYLLGVVYLNRALAGEAPSAEEKAKVPEVAQRFARAILQFQNVGRLKAKTPEHQHVVDLAWMAIGRLFYESGSELDAVDAYNHVDRTSPEYSTTLFELSWVYVRLGDFKRAQRALELLNVLSPETLHFADGSLLRADLMLRSKDYEGALRVYQSVKGRFAPILSDVNRVLETTKDPAVYYDQLVQERLGVRTERDLPPVVMDWVREESEDDRVFSLIDDVTRSRDLIRESQRMVARMGAVLNSTARAKAFPDMKLRMQVALGYLNEVAGAKRELLAGLEQAGGTQRVVDGEARRELLEKVDLLPVTVGDFMRREATGQEQWNGVSQRLQQLRLEVDKLQAVVNGLRRVMREPERFGIAQTPEARARFQAEIEANERDLEGYRKALEDAREAVDRGRVQIGFGDSRYIADRAARDEFDRVARAEIAAAAKGSSSAADYARRIAPLMQRAQIVEQRLRAVMAGYEAELSEKSKLLAAQIADEARRMQDYGDKLDSLDQNARLLVGEVAMRNFGLVRDRLKSIVLRADVGVVQQAWEVRERSRDRLQELQRRRSKQEQALTEELNEVLEAVGDDE